jgi:hypothetical protein
MLRDTLGCTLKGIAALAVLLDLLIAAHAGAQPGFPPPLAVQPASPSSDDAIVLAVFGPPCNVFDAVRINGQSIVVEVQCGGSCGVVPARQVPIGRLPAAQYTVIGRCVGSSATFATLSFTVTQGVLPPPVPAIPAATVTTLALLGLTLAFVAWAALKA